MPIRGVRHFGILTVLVGLLAGTGSAGATTVVTPDGQPASDFQYVANLSAMPSPPGTVIVSTAPCPASKTPRGCSAWDGSEIWTNGGDWTDSDTHALLWQKFEHELGHVYDNTVLTPWDRKMLTHLLGLSGPWWPAPETPDRLTPELAYFPGERFADAYALCGFRPFPTWREFELGYGRWHPSHRTYAAVCDFIKWTADRRPRMFAFHWVQATHSYKIRRERSK